MIKMDKSTFRSFLLNAGVIVIVFVAVLSFQSRNMLAADGRAAPELRGTTLNGQPYDLKDAAARPALVYFFAPWCKICAASAGNLNRLRRWRDPEDIEIVAVALDWDTAAEVRKYAERHELNVTVVLGDADLARQWRIYAFPSYYVLDSEHRIARRDIGYSSQLGLWFRAWLI
ncbi:MAG: TlpA disulfide reductase family protein [Woeseiaceae bacterium]|nr:TlpA disulfide reductase family protein [Woeseiaceae bacterium]